MTGLKTIEGPDTRKSPRVLGYNSILNVATDHRSCSAERWGTTKGKISLRVKKSEGASSVIHALEES